MNAANLPTDGSVEGPPSSRAGRTPGRAECSASVRVASEFLPIGPLNKWRPPLALVSLLEFAPVDPALGA